MTPYGQQIPPHVLLLKPAGSRAWALVVLVLALAAEDGHTLAAWCAPIQRSFRKSKVDFRWTPACTGKPVNVKSDDRVVTIFGNVDNGIEHTAAVQQASSVRGVKQLIDQVQVVPPAPPKPKIVVAAQPAPQKTPTINASFNFFRKAGGQQRGSTSAQRTSAPKAPAPRNPEASLFPKEKQEEYDWTLNFWSL